MFSLHFVLYHVIFIIKNVLAYKGYIYKGGNNGDNH